MKRSTSFGSLLPIYISIAVILISVLIIFSCSKKENDLITSPSFKTGTVKDIDGNVYQTVKIGQQWWMAENLKVTHYRNGDAIPNVTDNKIWSSLNTGACCCLNNNENNIAIYGLLYNGYSVLDNRNIAPEGWHVPTYEEFKELIEYLGGEEEASGKLMETGTEHWNEPNTCATNESGFTMLPGSYRSATGAFGKPGDSGGIFLTGCGCGSCENPNSAIAIYKSKITGCGAAGELTVSECSDLPHCAMCAMGCSVRCIKDDDDDD